MKLQFEIDIVETNRGSYFIHVDIVHGSKRIILYECREIAVIDKKKDAIKAARKWATENLCPGIWHWKEGVFE